MTTEDINRKLTAIFSADVKDYTRLMSQDEVGTIKTLTEHRKEISNFVTQYKGRVIDTPGDNILAAFESVSNAVNCAVEIQRELAEQNTEVPSARMMQWRIGINIGDIVEEEGRIYGDGVNIAARLESLSNAGSICISGRVYDQIQDKLGLEFEYQGEREVKNIARLIRTYSLLPKSKPKIETGKEKIDIPSDKPSIAILPFANMSSDPEQEYFSEGISEEILNGLAKNPGLTVKARTSSFSEKVRNQDVKTIVALLNVTHILEGSVRKSGNRIRITAQLIAADEDTHIWSDRYDRELTDIFEIQDEISDEILKALKVHLLGPDEKDIRTSNMEAYDAYLLGYYHLNRFQWEEAEKSFKKAVSLDPNYADAYGALARIYNILAWQLTGPVKNKLPRIRNYISKALSLDPKQIDALAIKNWLQIILDHKYQDAINQMTDLVKIYPFNLILLSFYQNHFANIDRIDIALKIANRMVELEPLNPKSHHDLGSWFFLLGRYDESYKTLEKMEAMGSSIPQRYAELAFAEGDIEGLQKQLDRGQSAWNDASHFYIVYEAAASYLKGDHKKVKEIFAPLWQSTDYVSSTLKSCMAALEGNLDLALDYYEQALSESEYLALHLIQAPTIISQIFPDYRSHPKYQKILRDVGLDEESIAKLKIPPLPF